MVPWRSIYLHSMNANVQFSWEKKMLSGSHTAAKYKPKNWGFLGSFLWTDFLKFGDFLAYRVDNREWTLGSIHNLYPGMAMVSFSGESINGIEGFLNKGGRGGKKYFCLKEKFG